MKRVHFKSWLTAEFVWNTCLWSVICASILSLPWLLIMPSTNTANPLSFALIWGISIIFGVMKAYRARQRWFKIPEARCLTCSYSLKNLTVARCPECGTLFDLKLLESKLKKHVTTTFRTRARIGETVTPTRG